jgi:hypothetical protein
MALYADVSLPLLPPPSWANRRNAMAWARWHISFSLLKLEHNEVLKKGSGYRQMNWLGHFGFEGRDADYSPRLRTLRSQQPGSGQTGTYLWSPLGSQALAKRVAVL